MTSDCWPTLQEQPANTILAKLTNHIKGTWLIHHPMKNTIHLTLKMISALVVEKSVTHNFFHTFPYPNDHTRGTITSICLIGWENVTPVVQMNLPWNMTWLNTISLVTRKLQSFEQMFGWHFRKIYHSHPGAPGEISDNKRHYSRFYKTMKVYPTRKNIWYWPLWLLASLRCVCRRRKYFCSSKKQWEKSGSKESMIVNEGTPIFRLSTIIIKLWLCPQAPSVSSG